MHPKANLEIHCLANRMTLIKIRRAYVLHTSTGSSRVPLFSEITYSVARFAVVCRT